jgi:tripartite-type tricarboxylate transporter receptor subunit TctC
MVLLLGTSLTPVFSGAASAADEPFKGKTVELLVGFGPGGGYDAYARALGRFIGAHIAGKPDVVVKNVPGAGSIKLANALYSVSPKDGTSFGTFDPNLITTPLLDPKKVKFDASKFNWVGSISGSTNVCISWHTSPVKSVDDLRTMSVHFGATGREVGRYMDAAIMRNLFGAKLQIITGYQGSSDVRLAMERGEIAGNCGDSWSSLKTTASDWLKEKKINILAQFGLQKHPEMPNVPLVLDMAKTDQQKNALKLLFAPRFAGRPYAAPPAVPADRVALLRAAFDATMTDAGFLAFADQAKLEVSPATGQQVADLISGIYRSSPEVVEAARKAIE